MSGENRETLNRAIGILEGINVSEDINSATSSLIEAVTEMLISILDDEKK